jgi:hypothetical protein
MSDLLKFILIFTTFLIIVFLGIAFMFGNSLDIDEHENMQKSQDAFNALSYDTTIISKLKLIEAFSSFLVNNIDSLNQSRNFQECLLVDMSYFAENFPACKKDSLDYFLRLIGHSTFRGLELCKNKNNNSNDSSFGNVEFILNIEVPLQAYYEVQHRLSYNRKSFPQALHIKTIQESLKKDTALIDNLKYSIIVSPYAGM